MTRAQHDDQWTRLVCGWAAAPRVRELRPAPGSVLGGAAHVGGAPQFDLHSTLFVARVAAKLSVPELAAAIGETQEAVEGYESGRAQPAAATVVSLEEVLQARLRM